MQCLQLAYYWHRGGKLLLPNSSCIFSLTDSRWKSPWRRVMISILSHMKDLDLWSNMTSWIFLREQEKTIKFQQKWLTMNWLINCDEGVLQYAALKTSSTSRCFFHWYYSRHAQAIWMSWMCKNSSAAIFFRKKPFGIFKCYIVLQ